MRMGIPVSCRSLTLATMGSYAPPYQYGDLDQSLKETRVVELLPGAFEESLRVKFHHVSLADDQLVVAMPRPASLEALQETLPPDWAARQCLDGRYLFERILDYEPEEPYETSWTHPVTGADPNLGEGDPDYEVLSYAWGPPGAEEEIHVLKPSAPSTGTSSFSLGCLAVRANLAAALRHLRYRDRERRLWIDALCINQSSASERSHQVYMMHDIYRHVRRVVVWLGAERDNSKLGVAVLQHLGEQAIYTEGGAWRTNVPGCSDPALARSSVPLPWDEWTWRAVADLLQRPWFSRLWSWQEVRLAMATAHRSVLICGFDVLPLALFRRAVLCASDKRVLPGAEIRGLLLDAVELLLPARQQPFFRELQALGWRRCADPRDRIYGALAAAPPALRAHLRPDYALSVARVYQQFCHVYLERLRRLDFLERCDLDARHVDDGPTWVPDWSVPVGRTARLPDAGASSHAAGASAAEVRPHSDARHEVLEALGVHCGTVTFVGDPAPADPEGLVAAVRAWARAPALQVGGTYAPTGEPALEALVTLLAQGHVRDRWPQCHRLPTAREAAQRHGPALTQPLPPPGPAGPASHAALVQFLRVRHCAFFTTDTGYVGTTTAGRPRPGDKLVVLLGCPAPLLLRAGLSGLHRVVGPAHAHGLRDGEALLGPLPRGWRARMAREHGFFDRRHFFHAASGRETRDDPRLGPLPDGWEQVVVDFPEEGQVVGEEDFGVRFRDR